MEPDTWEPNVSDDEGTETPKSTKTLAERSVTSLKRARKAAGQGFDEDPARAEFLIEEARILAVLDVAAALRGD